MVDVVVARIGKPHGIRGEVTAELRTDDPTNRLATGTELACKPARPGGLRVAGGRPHGNAWLMRFDGVITRNDAEELRGLLLLAPAVEGEDDAWHAHELRGLKAVTVDGKKLGVVTDLIVGVAQDRLVIECGGDEIQVPFVEEIVPDVDIDAGRVVLDPPYGLLPGEDDE